ncbi:MULTISPECIES: hypothetical protein [unclassified Bradyrhizobium]|uniref:hypothetical protein n=1 Tax=unclassified Bradyrhizobium TaxID=2631580 RepID=UPI001FFA6391|nr:MULTISPECIES: hypothetical protein [unclassified Bradyrhizobium]MCK1710272.1 hypothetical protein [Bradyrhizobium sp. 143]MCK1726620.1 hypothetical protein [Bradyrhizobium sp. 142]
MKRHRFKQDKTLGERLIKEARLAREKADQFPPDDAEREAFLKKAHELDAAANIDGWLNSRGLQPPK